MCDENLQTTEYRDAYDTGAASLVRWAGCGAPEMGVPFVTVPEGYKIEDLSRLLPTPPRATGRIMVTNAGSFCDYFRRFASDAGAVFADVNARTVTGFIDYHGEKPGWAQHSVTLTLQKTTEWSAWTSKNNLDLAQLAFAEFLEDRMGEIAEPPGSVLMDVVKHFEGKRSAHYRRGVNLANGAVQFEYVEEEESKTSGGVIVPTSFTLYLPIWKNSERVQIAARLRYRISEEKLTFKFVLDNPEAVVDAAFEKIVSDIGTGTQREVILGTYTPKF